MVEDKSLFLLDSKAVVEYIESYSNITFLGGGQTSWQLKKRF
jgi:hypothetical protein